MIRKRLVSLFLAVVMLCSLSMTAFAASDEDVAMSAEQGIIKTDEPRTLDFSWVRGFLVTNVCIVQRSAA